MSGYLCQNEWPFSEYRNILKILLELASVPNYRRST